MKVILLDDVQKLGRRGEVRDVSDGYARNFLIPKKLALSATAGNLKNLDHIKKQAHAKADRIKGDAEAVRDRIEALMYEERRQASEEGKLFGSVTSQDLDHPRQRLTTFEEDGAEHGALGVEIVRRDARGDLERAHARVSAHLGSMRPDGALGLVVSSTKKLTKSMVCGKVR